MNGKGVDWSMVGLVVLDDFFSPEVEHADGLVIGAGQHALVSWMETSISYGSFKTVVFLNLLLLLNIPDQQLLVLTARTHQRHVSIYLCAINPVVMAQEWSFEFLSVNVPHLNSLVIAGRKDCFAVIEEADWLDCSCVTFDDLRFDVGAGIPQSNGVIIRRAGDNILIGRECDAGYLFGMSIEREISFGIIDIPEADIIITARRSDVLTEILEVLTGRG
jgi:hypothetical protein